MADKNIKLVIEAILKDKGFQKGVKGMGTSMKKTSKIAMGFGKVLGAMGLAGGVYALVGAVKKAIKVQMEFEQSIANVASVSGDSKEQLKAIALQNAKLGYTAKEATDAMYYLASSGMKANQMAEVLEPTLTLAAAAQMGIAEATDIVVNNLKVFQTEGIKAQEVVDIMAQTVRSSNTNMQQMAEAAKYAGSEMSLAKVKFSDMAATIGAMANMGYKGSESGAKLRMVYARLGGGIPPVTKALKKYNITQKEINDLLPTPIKLFEKLRKANISNADATQIFGVRNKAVFKLIRDGMPDLKKLQKLMKEAGGVAKRMAEVQLDTLQGSLKELNVEWHKFALSLETGEMSKGIVKLGSQMGIFSTKSVAYLNFTWGVFRDIFKRMGTYSSYIWKKMTSHIKQKTENMANYTMLAYYKMRGFFSKYHKQLAKATALNIKNTTTLEFLIRMKAQSKWNKTKRDLFLKNEYYIMKLSKQLGNEIDKKEYERLLYKMMTRGIITEKMYKSEASIYDKTEDEKRKKDKKNTKTSIALIKDSLAEKKAALTDYYSYMGNQYKIEYNEEHKKYAALNKMYADNEMKLEEIHKQHNENLKKLDEKYIEKKKSLWGQMDKNQQAAFTGILAMANKVGSSIGGAFGEAVGGVTQFIDSMIKASGDPLQMLLVAVIATIGAIANEFEKGTEFRRMCEENAAEQLKTIDTGLLEQQLDNLRILQHAQTEALNDRHEAEINAFEKKQDLEMRSFLNSSEAGQAYNAMRAQEEADRVAAMDETEKKKYFIEKKYREEKIALEEKQATDKLAFEKKQIDEEKKLAKEQKIARNKIKKSQFNLEKRIALDEAFIKVSAAFSDVHAKFPMPWDAGTRDSLFSMLQASYDKTASLINSRVFMPEFKKGTENVGQTGAAYVHAGERIIPAEMNIPNISNPELIEAAAAGMPITQGGGIYNSTSNNNANNSRNITIQNVTLSNVTNTREMLMELQQMADGMGTSLLNV